MSRYFYTKPSPKKRMVLSFDGEEDLIVNRRNQYGYEMDNYVMVTGTPAPRPAPKPVVAVKPAPRPAVAPKPAPRPAVAPKPAVAVKPKPVPQPTPKPVPQPAPKLNLPNLNTMDCSQLNAEIARVNGQISTMRNANPLVVNQLKAHLITAKNLSAKKCVKVPVKDKTPTPTQEVTAVFPDLETLDCDGIKAAIDNAMKTLQTSKFSNPNSKKQYDDFIASAKALQSTKCQATPPPPPPPMGGGGGGGAVPPPEEEPQAEEGQEQGEQPQEQGEQPQAQAEEVVTAEPIKDDSEERKRNTYYVLGVIGIIALIYFLNE